MPIKLIKISLISLGCARNLVDSEVILGTLKNSGFAIMNSPRAADIAIVNTCSFIEDAKKESIETILDLIDLKTARKNKGGACRGLPSPEIRQTAAKGVRRDRRLYRYQGFTRLPKLISDIMAGKKESTASRVIPLISMTGRRPDRS